MVPMLLDTCAALWMTKNQPLSDEFVDAIDLASDHGDPIFISPISVWEVALQMTKGRMTIATTTQVWFDDLKTTPGIVFADLSAPILLDSVALPDFNTNDPADRIIVATARTLTLRIVTRDRKILDYAARGHVLALAC